MAPTELPGKTGRPSDVSAVSVRGYGPIVVFTQSDQPRELGGYIPDALYPTAVATLPIYCVDAIPYNWRRRTIFLVERCVLPMRGLWVLGGRGELNELPPDVIRRKLFEEAGLQIEESRLSWLGIVPFYRWDDSKQYPDGPGGNNFCGLSAFEPTVAELATMAAQLKPTEYNVAAGVHEYGQQELEALYLGRVLHPMLLMAYYELFRITDGLI